LLIKYKYHDYNLEVAKIFQSVTGYKILPYSEFACSMMDRLDVLISVQLPSHFCKNLQDSYPLLGEIPPHIKFIYWVDEIHWDDDETRSEMMRYMDRADLLISPPKSVFSHWYPEFAPKLKFFPWFAHDRFVFQGLNPHCDLTCLSFAGAPQAWMPLRYKIEKEGPSRLGAKLNLMTHACAHPQKTYLFADYAKLLRRHFCAFTAACDSTMGLTKTFTGETRATLRQLNQRYPHIQWDKPVGHLHLKQFEIPCVGSLLICDGRPEEMKEIGFKAGENFVLADESNVFDVISDCVENPDRYTPIRQAGMELIQKNHLAKNRVASVKQWLTDLGIKPHKTML
jgi:hypothetical protein